MPTHLSDFEKFLPTRILGPTRLLHFKISSHLHCYSDSTLIRHPRVIDDLKAKGMYEDSVIIFSSDNGGNMNLGATNNPLKGQKIFLFEGGVRVNGFVHSPNHIVNPG